MDPGRQVLKRKGGRCESEPAGFPEKQDAAELALPGAAKHGSKLGVKPGAFQGLEKG